MAKPGNIRKYGALPERRHDAFLLALLLALSLSITFFTVQALLPRLAYLLQMLGPSQAVQLRQMPDEEEMPFVMVDPDLLDEDDDSDLPAEALARLTRQARQTEETPELPEERSYREDGIDEILTPPDGNPGPLTDYTSSDGDISEPAPVSDAGTPEEEPPPEETPDEPQETEPEAAEPAEETAEEMPPDETPEPAEPFEEVPELTEPPPAEPETAEPPPVPEDLPEEMPPPPEDVPEEALEELPEITPEDPEDISDITEPEDDPAPAQTEDPIDIAMLPPSDSGYLDPESRRLEEIITRNTAPPAEPLRPPERPEITEAYHAPAPPETAGQQTPVRRERPPNSRRPEFRRIGSDPSAPAPPRAAAGGAPARRNNKSRTELLDSDASMKLLQSRYGEYMEKVGRALQESLNRQMFLSPMSIGRGQVKIRFGISPDGSLTYQETIFPEDGTLVAERILSEQVVREAAPFGPLTPEMQQDHNFQRLTVTVFLH